MQDAIEEYKRRQARLDLGVKLGILAAVSAMALATFVITTEVLSIIRTCHM